MSDSVYPHHDWTEPAMLTIESPESPARLTLSPDTGLPAAIDVGSASRPVRMHLTASIGGREERGETGGLAYVDTAVVDGPQLIGTEVRRIHRGTCDEYALETRLGPIAVTLRYRLFPTSPFIEVVADLSAPDPVVVRDVSVECHIIGDPDRQRIFSPGNAIRRGIHVSDLGSAPFGISALGGLRGASGIVGVEEDDTTLVVWPNQPTEVVETVATSDERGLHLVIDTRFAAELGPAGSAELMLATLDLGEGCFADRRAQWGDWASRYGLTTPADKPAWVRAASLYEAQIGVSHFWGGNTYSRYLEIDELTADLDRIRALGFTVIQLMPRQPYPSYNVHDYADISTSYGDEAQLRTLVQQAHLRGMRVILDVLLHGVLDNESVDAALEGIERGRLSSELDRETGDSFSSDLSDRTNYLIAWSRHIRDFAEHWKGGSPQRTPLEHEHPEWFYRSSGGQVTGVYTKAFDARHPGWQRYFREAMIHLLTTLDADGFRFDAPTYNDFANWAGWARARASSSALGCLPLFVDLRRDIKAAKGDALMYTEPSGHLLRRSMDVNYNYDEQWLVTALAGPTDPGFRGIRSAREFMEWIQDRDAFLPPGSQTAHHIDSHDTFWWPQWGKKWRREQFGIDRVKALSVTFLALDGPFMMFCGGEDGIEDELRLMASVRQDSADYWRIPGRLDTESDPTGDLLIMHRQGVARELAVIVNHARDDRRRLPKTYTEGWAARGSWRFHSDGLDPCGYVILERNRG